MEKWKTFLLEDNTKICKNIKGGQWTNCPEIAKAKLVYDTKSKLGVMQQDALNTPNPVHHKNKKKRILYRKIIHHF